VKEAAARERIEGLREQAARLMSGFGEAEVALERLVIGRVRTGSDLDL
jgi:hypothetical protein